MAVIRQFPENSGCSVCNSLVDLPHESLDDCRRALSREMDQLLSRAKAITTTQRSLTVKRLKDLGDRLSPDKKRRKR